MSEPQRSGEPPKPEDVEENFKVKFTEAELNNPDNKIYHGGCHCKYITYTARLNFKTNSPSRCNCTICHKASLTCIRTQNPKEDFKFLTPPVSISSEPLPAEGSQLGHFLKGIEADPGLSVYKFGVMNHVFCKKCGIRIIFFGWIEPLKADMLSVNLATLDDNDELDLTELTKPGKVRYWDMRHDNWAAGQKDSPWHPGMW